MNIDDAEELSRLGNERKRLVRDLQGLEAAPTKHLKFSVGPVGGMHIHLPYSDILLAAAKASLSQSLSANERKITALGAFIPAFIPK